MGYDEREIQDYWNRVDDADEAYRKDFYDRLEKEAEQKKSYNNMGYSSSGLGSTGIPLLDLILAPFKIIFAPMLMMLSVFKGLTILILISILIGVASDLLWLIVPIGIYMIYRKKKKGKK